MGRSIVLVFLTFVPLATVAVSCAPQPTVSPTLFPTTATYPPTGTAVHEDTLTPTSTSLSPTPIPPTPSSLSLVAEYLTDVKALSYDPLDKLDNWNVSSTVQVIDGVLEMDGLAFWASRVSAKSQFIAGNGIILKFKVQAAIPESAFVFDTGSWQTESFKEFGIDPGRRSLANLWQGTQNLGRQFLPGKLRLEPDTWYGLMMVIGENGRLLAVMWDPADDTHRIIHELFREDWSGNSWTFSASANEGETVYIDDFYHISFGAIK